MLDSTIIIWQIGRSSFEIYYSFRLKNLDLILHTWERKSHFLNDTGKKLLEQNTQLRIHLKFEFCRRNNLRNKILHKGLWVVLNRLNLLIYRVMQNIISRSLNSQYNKKNGILFLFQAIFLSKFIFFF